MSGRVVWLRALMMGTIAVVGGMGVYAGVGLWQLGDAKAACAGAVAAVAFCALALDKLRGMERAERGKSGSPGAAAV